MLLVTGGAGYIGSHFVKLYLDRNPDVKLVVIDNLSTGHREALLESDRVIFVEEDVSGLQTLEDIFRTYPVSAVVHFANNAYVGESQKNPGKYLKNNVVNGLNLLDVMEAAGVRKFIYSSSCAVYGKQQTESIDESHPISPVNVYGLTKKMFEEALAAYAEQLGWSYIALRYFNAAGADADGLIGESHSPETHLIPNALKAAAGKKQCVDIFGEDYDTPDGTCIRDYVHVNDLCEGHIRALDFLDTTNGGETINLGSAEGTSVRQILDMCSEVTGCEIAERVLPRRDGDPVKLVASAKKAEELLKWSPSRSLREIIRSAWMWEQSPRY